MGLDLQMKERPIKFGEDWKVKDGLPRKTHSLCPECLNVISANLFEEDGKVIMEKKCFEHGHFRDILSTNAPLFKKIEKWSLLEGEGIENPMESRGEFCPKNCGLCNNHHSTPSLTNVDLTNRCNLRCPFCFANANVADYVYEPSLEEIKNMLDVAISVKPKRQQAVQFSGGEPTLSPHFVEACRYAKKLGFARIQAATNGITLAKDWEFAQKAREAGLDTLYLQFDGTDKEIYKRTRNSDLWEIKQKVVEVARKLDIAIILVPTIVKTVNDDQVGKILQFAVDNVDVIPGISYQPVCFTGRIDCQQRLRQRFTLSDLAQAVEDQTGYAKTMRDWYPLTMLNPITRLMDAFVKENGVKNMFCSCHTNCGIGTFLFVNRKTKEIIALSEVFDMEKANLDVLKIAEKMEKKPSRIMALLSMINMLRRNFKPSPEHKLTRLGFIKVVDSLTGGQLGFAKKARYQWRMIYCAGMHFQDAYNYDVERVKRCVIHYSAPDGRMYPFCTYNSGPFFRESIEKQFSFPKKQWLETRGDKYISTGFFEER
jgi:uncharacterized radical SAM superfamily Fe-S cluster-containing enzyme